MENHLVALLVASLAGLGLFVIAWRLRTRAVRRLLIALDSYAEQEIAQERLRQWRGPRVQGFAGRAIDPSRAVASTMAE
jgi:hypothetical protein